MYLSGLSLQHFRNYDNRTFLFKKPLTIILAPNASGKTNILEAIHLISTGESFRAGKVDDFIQINQEYGRVKGKIEVSNQLSESNESVSLEILLTKGLVNGKRAQKKIFSLNEVRKQRRAILGLFPTIAFIPEDLRLITGSPSRRREFLNTILMQIDPNYATALSTYDQTLRRRNKLLLQIRDGQAPRTVLSFWDLSLVKHGEYVQQKRTWLIDQLNQIEFPMQFEVEYQNSLMSAERLKQYEREEVAVGHTLVGPHKDDIVVKFSISASQFPLFTHGSRGQQRMGVLWMKLGAFEVIRQKLGKTPLLLLDDIFSELDLENRRRVLELASTTQTIMTSAEEDILNMKELETADIMKI